MLSVYFDVIVSDIKFLNALVDDLFYLLLSQSLILGLASHEDSEEGAMILKGLLLVVHIMFIYSGSYSIDL